MEKVPKLALVGHPNVGKSTIFNALTGGRAKVGNYSGVTVEKKTGEFFTPHGHKMELVDLPGCHSLISKAADEAVTRDVLLGLREGEEAPDLVIVVVDGSALERHLPLVFEVMELKLPVVLVLNKIDLAERDCTRIGRGLLAEELGLPVVAMRADKGDGLLDLKQALRFPLPLEGHLSWRVDHSVEEGVKGLTEKLEGLGIEYPERSARMLLADSELRTTEGSPFKREVQVAAREVANTIIESGKSPEEELEKARRSRVREVVKQCVSGGGDQGTNWSDRIDSELLHPLRGWIYFAAIFFLVFWSLFNWAGIPMDWIDGWFGSLGESVRAVMPEGTFTDLLVDGIIAGVGGVVIFLPQILFLFFFLGILESTGYMARAGFLMDGLMSRVGLSGRSFLPLLSGYACAIPGVMATRAVPSAKERLLTILVLPWMSCSARLPVYLLLIPLLVEGAFTQAVILFWLYSLGTVTAFAAAYYLRGAVGISRDYEPSFLLEMPRYKWPDFGFIFRHLVERAGSFLKKAGTVILGISILLWALAAFPAAPSGEEAEQFSYSAMGRLGNAIEPVVEPLGWDQRLGTAMLASFAAREVFNSQVAISYAIDEEDEERAQNLVRSEFRKSYGLPTVLSLLVFYVFALQCLPTTAVVSREAKSWRIALGQLVGMSVFAYLAAWATFQLANLIL